MTDFIAETTDHGWTAALSEAASREGWDLFDSDGSISGPWQVQSFDDPDAHGEGSPDIEDGDAWELVARQDTPHARAVLAFLATANPLEHARILAWPTVVGGTWDYDNDQVVWKPSA